MGPDAKRRTKGCLVLSLFIGIPGCMALNWLEDTMCKTTIYDRAVSPTGLLEARVQMTDCGATSGFSRVVWVKPRYMPDSQIVSCRAVIFEEQPNVALRWSDDGLKIAHDSPSEFIREPKVQCYFTLVVIKGSAINAQTH
jgi:hypothetical protein